MNSKPHTVIGVLPPIPQYPIRERSLYDHGAMPHTVV